jgi:hypothetical protein
MGVPPESSSRSLNAPGASGSCYRSTRPLRVVQVPERGRAGGGTTATFSAGRKVARARTTGSAGRCSGVGRPGRTSVSLPPRMTWSGRSSSPGSLGASNNGAGTRSAHRGVHRLADERLDRFHDDVEAVVDDLLTHARHPVFDLEGWVAGRLNAATVNGHRRLRGERGALQRPRLPGWLGAALGQDR